jgi:hypothetical protein
MSGARNSDELNAAWNWIESLGGFGVWEPELVVVSFAKTSVSDGDLAVLRGFPIVQTLILSDTSLTDACLIHLDSLDALEELIVVDTKISKKALAEFRRRHPSVKVVTDPPTSGSVNPFTGKPF